MLEDGLEGVCVKEIGEGAPAALPASSVGSKPVVLLPKVSEGWGSEMVLASPFIPGGLSPGSLPSLTGSVMSKQLPGLQTRASVLYLHRLLFCPFKGHSSHPSGSPRDRLADLFFVLSSRC